METQAKETAQAPVITPESLLDHWQGHRRLTRKVIEAFPEDQFFSYSIGGMRPFSELVREMLELADLGIEGIVTGQWKSGLDHSFQDPNHPTKVEVLRQWDRVTEKMNNLWPQIPPHRFGENDTAFGQYDGTVISFILYFIDNEIHHRAQGYVYLRSLNIEPPFFWERE